MEDCLCFLVECNTLILIRTHPGTFQHILHLVASVKGNIKSRFLSGGFAQQIVEKVIWITTSTLP
jgi:hypothetical protein